MNGGVVTPASTAAALEPYYASEDVIRKAYA